MELTREQIKRGILLSVSVSVISIVLVILLTQDEFSFKMFTRIDPTYLLISAYITFIFWAIKALKLKLLTESLGGKISFYKSFSIYMASAFVSHVTPSSSGGLPFEIYFLHREGLPLGKTTALTVVENMFNILFFMVATPFLVVIWGEHLNLGPAIIKLFYIAIILVVAFVMVSIVLMFNAHLARVFINWLTSLALIKKLFSEETLLKVRLLVKEEVDYFSEGMHILLRNKGDLFLVLVYTVIYWVFYLSLAPVLLRGLGLNVPIPSVILAQLVFNYIQPIIPTPGGSGGAELSFAYLFKFLIPRKMLGVFVAVWRFFMFYTSLIVGGLFFIILVRGTDYLEQK